MTRSDEEVRLVLDLARQGMAQAAIARATGIPRTTVRMWLGGALPRERAGRHAPGECPWVARVPPLPYAYLLGLYLGDGYLATQPRGVYRLRVTLDLRYPGIIEECGAAMRAVLPNKVGHAPRVGCVDVGSSSKHWPCLFPQHGPGRKHLRPIVLEPWQQAIVGEHPDRFLRGLIHSDGCRHTNSAIVRGKRYLYPRYEFTNASDDLHRLFQAACDHYGVRWTRPKARTTSVARAADVARLDLAVGPKR